MIGGTPQEFMQTMRQRQEVEPRDQLRIPQPLGITRLQTTVTTIYTAGANSDFEIGGLIISDVTVGPETVSIYFVPDGGTAGPTNAAVIDLAIAANTLTRLSQFDGLVLAPGTSIQALCSTNDSVNIMGWGYDYQGAYA